MSDQIKPTCAVYILHSRQGQSLGDQDLMKFLNLVNDPQYFIWSGTRFHILCADFVSVSMMSKVAKNKKSSGSGEKRKRGCRSGVPFLWGKSQGGCLQYFWVNL